jgi:hypothetical protein
MRASKAETPARVYAVICPARGISRVPILRGACDNSVKKRLRRGEGLVKRG